MTDMSMTLTEEQQTLKRAVLDLCKLYPGAYWRELDDKQEYPHEFVNELTKAGYLGALIPEAYGGGGLNILEGGLILEAINESGGNATRRCTLWARCYGTVHRNKRRSISRRLPPASCACRRLA
jgi:alkylation response protein AidB-like acyl-CoA dehydrogenase